MTPAIPPAAPPSSAAPALPSASADPGNTADAAAAAGFNAVLQEKMAAPAKGQAEADKIAAPAVDPAAESAAVTDPAVDTDAAAAALMPQLAALLGVLEGGGSTAAACGEDTRATASLQPPRSTAADTSRLSPAPLSADSGDAPGQGAEEPPATASGACLTAADATSRSTPAPAASGAAAGAMQAAAGKEQASQALLSAVENAAASQTQLHAPGNPVVSPSSGPAHTGDALPTQHVSTPLGAPGWSNEIGQKIVLLAGRSDSRAELTLTPPHLGKVDITLSINGDQTSATFVSASQAARDALEQALPRLREMLADAGISLGQASVNAHASGQDAQDFSSGRHEGTGHDQAGSGTPAASRTHWLQRSEGLVDTFA